MLTQTLCTTLRSLGACARKVAHVAPIPITANHAELQVGIGTCADWIAWASRLRGLDFSTSIKRGSPRAESYLESTRFSYAWTAANALFSRDAVLSRLSTAPLPIGELKRFRVLWRAAALTPAEDAAFLAPLHTILTVTRTPDEFPWATLSSIRVLDVIYYKYTPSAYKSKGESAKAIEAVVQGTKPVTSLDLPMLLYSTRNWMLHGALLNSSFRGSPKHLQVYITTATEALAVILDRSALALGAVL